MSNVDFRENSLNEEEIHSTRCFVLHVKYV
jgi:hypothetical protein